MILYVYIYKHKMFLRFWVQFTENMCTKGKNTLASWFFQHRVSDHKTPALVANTAGWVAQTHPPTWFEKYNACLNFERPI